MEALLYFVFWAAFIFVMMRMGCGSHVMGGHGHNHSKHRGNEGADEKISENLRWEPPQEDMDPVCKKTVRTNDARPSVYDGAVYYFCSRECREIFEAAPELYIGPQAEAEVPKLEANNV